MNSALKQRLVGAVVLVAIAVIFVPSFLRERQVEPVSTTTLIPDPPTREAVTFDRPVPPEGVEPAPDPETMFLPDESAEATAPEQAEVADEDAATETDPQEDEGNAERESQADNEPPSEERATDGKAWVIQVASFREAERASELRDRLQDQGYRAYIRSASTSAGEVSRVFIGPKISRRDAESTKAAVDAALKVNALILRFEP